LIHLISERPVDICIVIHRLQMSKGEPHRQRFIAHFCLDFYTLYDRIQVIIWMEHIASISEDSMSEITGIILAGGASRRLNYRNKALLKIGDRSVIERVIDTLSEVTESILLITNSPGELGHLELPMFGDVLPGSGSLGGIYTGLKVSKTHHNLVVACDMPFIRPHLLTFLINRRRNYDVVIPVTSDGHHPTCAIYSRNCVEPIEAQIRTGNLKISDFFPHVKVNRIDFSAANPCYDPNILFNINTREDYAKALSIAGHYSS
jgi:molybdopterin-guanine dinucleotide biosynthesis protein A